MSLKYHLSRKNRDEVFREIHFQSFVSPNLICSHIDKVPFIRLAYRPPTDPITIGTLCERQNSAHFWEYSEGNIIDLGCILEDVPGSSERTANQIESVIAQGSDLSQIPDRSN